MSVAPNERFRTPEKSLQPNQDVFTVSSDYTLQRDVFIGVNGDQAIVNTTPVGDPATWVERYNLAQGVQRGERQSIRRGQFALQDNSDVESGRSLPYEDIKLLNPLDASLIGVVQRAATELTNLKTQGVTDPNCDIGAATRGLKDITDGRMTLDAYTAIEQRATVYLHRIMDDFALAVPDKRVSSANGGYEFALECLQIVDTALIERQTALKDKITDLEQELKQLNNKSKLTFEQDIRCVEITASVKALRTGARLLDPIRNNREQILMMVGRLAVASDWYHKTNPAQQK